MCKHSWKGWECLKITCITQNLIFISCKFAKKECTFLGKFYAVFAHLVKTHNSILKIKISWWKVGTNVCVKPVCSSDCYCYWGPSQFQGSVSRTTNLGIIVSKATCSGLFKGQILCCKKDKCCLKIDRSISFTRFMFWKDY